MKRIMVLLGLSVAVLVTCFTESEACGRRRRSCTTVCAPPVIYYYEVAPMERVPEELAPYKSPKGTIHRVFNTFSGETTEHDRPDRSLTGAGASPDMFLGKARKVAKTSISNAPVKTFPNLNAVLDSLPPDSVMRAKPLVNKPRVTEEERNVSVLAFIHAVKKEADNDFHIILGSAADANASRFMTAEVSGLPEAGPFKAPLKKARDKFKSHASLGQIMTASYIKFEPAIPVKVQGSLFYDIDHPPGAIGPIGFKPKTAWEIHPVTDIEFEP